MRHFIALFTLLFFAIPANAQWTVGTATEKLEAKYDQTFTYAFSATGTSSSFDFTGCSASVDITLASDSDAEVDVYDCRESTSSIQSDCRKAAVLPKADGSFGPIGLQVARGQLLVDVQDNGSGSGTGTLTFECSDVVNSKYESGSWGTSYGSGIDSVATRSFATTDPIDGTTLCETGDDYLNTATGSFFVCEDGSTDDWTLVEPTNVPLDRDGDGNPDYVRVQCDYDGDTNNDVDDIQAAINDLTDTDSQRLVEVGACEYADSESANLAALVVLPSQTTLKCDPGANITGPDLTELNSRLAQTRIITNDSLVQTDRTSTGDGLGDTDIYIEGSCSLRFDLASSYDSDDAGGGSTIAQGGNHFGIYLDQVTNGHVIGAQVDSTIHSCFYFRGVQNFLATGNRAGDGCGSSNDTNPNDTFNFPGFYWFSYGTISRDIVADANICTEAGSECFHTRADNICVGTDGGDEDGDFCRLDNGTAGGATDCTATNGTCSAGYVEHIVLSNNVARNAGTNGFGLSSLRDAVVDGNTIENSGFYGISFNAVADSADPFCSDASPSDDAKCRVTVSNNNIQNSALEGINVFRGMQDMLIAGNLIHTTAADCIQIEAPFDHVTVTGNHMTECDGANNSDGIVITQNAAPADNLIVTSNTVVNVGNDVNGSLIQLVAAALDQSAIIGNHFGDDNGSASDCIQVTTTPTAAASLHVEGNDCEDTEGMLPHTQAAMEALTGRSHIITDGATPTGTCQNGLLWQDTSDTVSPGGISLCVNGSFVTLD